MKKKLFIVIFVISLCIMLFGYFYSNQKQSPYVLFNNQKYYFLNLFTHENIGRNFIEIHKEEHKIYNTIDDNMTYYYDSQQKEILYTKCQDHQYYKLYNENVVNKERIALAPMIYIQNQLYFQKDDVKVSSLSKSYQKIGTLDYFYENEPKQNNSTNQESLLYQEIYFSRDEKQFIYVKNNQDYVQWQIE